MNEQGFHKIFDHPQEEFDALALEIFSYQYAHNPVYRDYVTALGKKAAAIHTVTDIPFLPIRFFKSHTVTTGSFEPAAIFKSSGTTGSINSRHWVKDLALYEKSFRKGFEQFYGPVEDYVVIGLLPSYLERSHSSLVYMVNTMIAESKRPESGFYLYEFDKLAALLKRLEQQQVKVLLIGVSFALLDLAEQFPMALQHTIIMETGGMKGRREEMIRAALHEKLQKAFSVQAIHSEYGMTELLSQAWSSAAGIFKCPGWMKVLIRDEEDPLTIKKAPSGKEDAVSGAINIIDLANIHSCSFIATDDAGRLYGDGSFEVLGRIDNSDIRGCSLLYTI
jgi:phenylacetate-coenzyme A ligase PaaK-like adenylate-forming protein